MADGTRLVAILILVVIGAVVLTWFLWTASYLTGGRYAIYEHRPRRRLRAQFRRIGISGKDGIRISMYDPDEPPVSITLADVDRPGELSYEWYGKLDLALERLGTVPDGAGRDRLWAAFPDRTRSPRDVAAELERIGPFVQYRMQATDDVVLLDAPYLREERQWEWRAGASEALRRLREIPDDAERADFWAAFPERSPSVEFRVFGELARIGCEGVVPNHKYLKTHTLLLFEVRPGEWWEGSAAEALKRLERVPSAAGREAMWEEFPDRASRGQGV